MRRPPYSRRVMSGILLIYRKMTINIENGYLPAWWSRQDINDVKRALKWVDDFLDWVEWLAAEKEKARLALEADPPVIEEEGEDV